MKKMMINRKPVEGPWGGGNNFTKSICQYANDHDINLIFKFEDDIDYILMLDPRTDGNGMASMREIQDYKLKNPKTKVFYRCNECDARKGDKNIVDPLIRYTSTFIDACIFVSPWMLNYHTWEVTKTLRDPWQCSNNIVIYNGVNKEHFRPTNNKINNGKINIVTHHWSDNPMKGQDIYDMLDDWLDNPINNENFTFTYIGRTKSKFKHSKHISPLSGLELGNELQKYDIYISASKFDPGPNHILESLACNLPTLVHELGGGAVDMAGVMNTFSSFDSLVKRLEDFRENRRLNNTDEVQHQFDLIDWQECVANYINFMKTIK